MKRVEQIERHIDRHLLRVRELCPCSLVVWLDRGLVLSQAELEANVGVHVTVGDVMDDLLHRPATRPVSSFELVARQASYGRSQRARSLRDLSDKSGVVGFADRGIPMELADWVAKVDFL